MYGCDFWKYLKGIRDSAQPSLTDLSTVFVRQFWKYFIFKLLYTH